MTFDQGSTDDGKRSEAEGTLHYAGMKREGGSGGRGYRDHPGHHRTLGRRMTGSAAKRSGRCVMLELKERGVPGGEGTAIIPGRTGH